MVDQILHASREALTTAPGVASAEYAAFCDEVRIRLHERWDELRDASTRDAKRAAERGSPARFVERITLTDEHVDQLDALVTEVRATLPALVPVHGPGWDTGVMTVRRVPRPLGVILFLYEARPTVTVEGALLAVAAGNAVLLRGSSEIAETNKALGALLADSLTAAGLPRAMVQVLADADRGVVRTLLTRPDAIDLLIPRGGPSLIDYCRDRSTIPMIASGGGVNHLYVHASADVDQAAAIALDSKVVAPTACNSVEMVLVDDEIGAEFVAALLRHADESDAGFTLRLPPRLAVEPTARVRIQPLADHDAGREFMDHTLAVSPVSGPTAAIEHIARYGSAHTDAIVSADAAVVDLFCRQVDSAAVVVNGSLRLHDGPTMRLGPEVSISTGRLHVRGPVGPSSLLTYSWVIEGNGALRGGTA